MNQTMMDAAQVGGALAKQHDLSPIGLFMGAHWVVQIVMFLLLAASVCCWAIIFEKSVRMRRINARVADFEDSFWSGGSLDTLFDQVSKGAADPMSATFAAGMREWRHASDRGLPTTGSMRANLQQRVERVMSVTIGREMANAERYMTFLASVGSTAPFLGLFGTVWGIMHSFTAIAATNNTSLTVVAPGIAEALFATALGLVAAIPAVLAYNKFSTDINHLGERLDAFAGEFAAILSRHLEEPRS
ncbi:Tol-Pal system protein TolQ [Azospirillaceae bacterium]